VVSQPQFHLCNFIFAYCRSGQYFWSAPIRTPLPVRAIYPPRHGRHARSGAAVNSSSTTILTLTTSSHRHRNHCLPSHSQPATCSLPAADHHLRIISPSRPLSTDSRHHQQHSTNRSARTTPSSAALPLRAGRLLYNRRVAAAGGARRCPPRRRRYVQSYTARHRRGRTVPSATSRRQESGYYVPCTQLYVHSGTAVL
jgi:hypothetical protein